MTKQDRESVMIGGAFGIGFVVLAWFLRSRTVIPVLRPTQIKFENQ